MGRGVTRKPLEPAAGVEELAVDLAALLELCELRLHLQRLLEAVEEVIRALPQPILHRVVPRPLDVEGATCRIEALLHERDRFSFRDALGAAPTVADVISTLLAILELARVGRIRLAQRAPFGSVDLWRGSIEQAA